MNHFNYKDYNEYLTEQIRAYNLKKNTHQWAKEEDIKILADYIERFTIEYPKTGLCHGVRSGAEVDWFSSYLKGADVLGTELGITSKHHVIQHDFNKPMFDNTEYDFIYSNSFDHAWNQDTFYVWMDQLKPNSLLLIEHTGRDEKANQSDCLGMEIIDFVKLPFLVNVIPLKATERQKYKLVFVYRRIS